MTRQRRPHNFPTCFECGGRAHVHHHVVPYSRGGTRTLPLCMACHDKVHEIEGNRTAIGTLIKEGIDRARALGKHVGRPPAIKDPKVLEHYICAMQLLWAGASFRGAAEAAGVPRRSLERLFTRW